MAKNVAVSFTQRKGEKKLLMLKEEVKKIEIFKANYDPLKIPISSSRSFEQTKNEVPRHIN